MTALTAEKRPWQSPKSLFLDIREGFIEITRHSLALLGMALLAVVLTFAARPNLQNSASEWLMGWLTSRQDEALAQAVQDLLPEQAKVTHWLSRKYRVAPLALEPLVAEAWQVGQLSQLPPTLILAVMGAESGFNPFARGTQGAMGLMQIEPVAHAETLKQFGGQLAAFDPLTNLRIGARLLQAQIRAAGSLEEGLRQYGRASGQSNEQTYVERVMGEHRLMERVAAGRSSALTVPGPNPRP
ncbi:MAG: transglycosylase SLT domain-containing protein [Limnohabitans sp.]|jgi:soluble lytic murein transglycosylase-like protein